MAAAILITGESMAPTSADIVVLTVIEPEATAFRKAAHLQHDGNVEAGDIYWAGTLPNRLSGRRMQVVLHSLGQQGNSEAAAATARLVARHDPKMCLLVGIAAGIRKRVRIGDVVTSRAVADDTVHVAVAGQSLPRPQITAIPHVIRQMIGAQEFPLDRWRREFKRIFTPPPRWAEGAEDFRQMVAWEEPEAHDAVVYSSDRLLRDDGVLSGAAQNMHQQTRAGEMEAAGFVRALAQSACPKPWLVVRGVSDFGDSFKDDAFHRLAASAAASYAVTWLRHVLDLRLFDTNRSPSTAAGDRGGILPAILTGGLVGYEVGRQDPWTPRIEASDLPNDREQARLGPVEASAGETDFDDTDGDSSEGATAGRESHEDHSDCDIGGGEEMGSDGGIDILDLEL